MDKAHKFQFAKEIDYTIDGIVSKQIIKNTSGNVTLFAFGKLQGLSEHTAPFDAMVQVIEGKAEVQIDKEAFVLNSGESIILPANVPHALKALEAFKMVLTMIRGN